MSTTWNFQSNPNHTWTGFSVYCVSRWTNAIVATRFLMTSCQRVAQDWGIWLKFCVLTKNYILKWTVWPKIPYDENSIWRRPPFRILLKCHYMPWVGEFSSNSVRWCRITPCRRKCCQKHHFCKNKTTAAAIFDLGKIAITSSRIERFGSNCIQNSILNRTIWPKNAIWLKFRKIEAVASIS